MTVLPFRVVGPRCSVKGCGHVETYPSRAARDAARTAAWNRKPVCWCHPQDGRPRYRFLCDVSHSLATAATDG